MSLRLRPNQRIRKQKDFHIIHRKGKFARGKLLNIWVYGGPEIVERTMGPKLGMAARTRPGASGSDRRRNGAIRPVGVAGSAGHPRNRFVRVMPPPVTWLKLLEVTTRMRGKSAKVMGERFPFVPGGTSNRPPTKRATRRRGDCSAGRGSASPEKYGTQHPHTVRKKRCGVADPKGKVG